MSTTKTFDCVLLADRHHGLTEGVCGLLQTAFRTVVMVSDEGSLQESAARLRPQMIIVDLSLARDGTLKWLRKLRRCCPDAKLVVLSFYDVPSVRRAVIDSGADGFVPTRVIATQLMPTVEQVLRAPHASSRARSSK
jgi:DNA-binding NarL/FixJ family response regulator